MIAEQVHNKFKVFMGPLDGDSTLGALADEVAAFAAREGVAAKSIGVEYLEGLGQIVVSLGYTTGEAPYPIRLQTVLLGKIDVFGKDFTALEASMGAAAAGKSNIICHELYLTGAGEIFLVVMTHEG
jgi:hypothetical protein